MEKHALSIPRYHWLTVVGHSKFVFRVKACRDVQIFLGETLGNIDVMVAEVMIGANNEFSTITYSNQEVTRYSPGILSCNEFRTFHITWSTSSVILGSGSDINENVILQFNTDELFNIQAIGLLYTDTEIEYEIVKLKGNYS